MKHTKYLVQAAAVAALYVVLTYITNLFGLANGVIQCRISEALTVLPFFTPAAIPGLFVGCLLSNIITGCAPWDIVFGSLATLAGAFGTYYLRKYCKGFLSAIPPILANMLVVPFVLMYVYAAQEAYWFLLLTVGAGEVISCGILGTALLIALKPVNKIFRL